MKLLIRALIGLAVIIAVGFIVGAVLRPLLGAGVAFALLLLALPGFVLAPEKDSRFSLRTFFLFGRWGGGGI